MKQIRESPNTHNWPRQKVANIDCRKRDLVIRIADWTRDKDAPYYDVEVYVGGVYDWNESKSCATKAEAKRFAAAQVAKLL